MQSKLIARFAGISAGAAMALGVFAPAGAQTIAELQAQIAALMAQLQALSGGASASATITSDLTVGSTGSQVVALQNALVAQGHLVMPAGVAPGYFGALTKAAVAKWQAAMGLPATGYFGPLSRAKFAGTTTGGTTGGTTTVAPGVITTPGVEGTLTVTNAPVSVSTLYEGQTMKDVLAFKAEADLSDIALQRVKIDLGTDTTLYRDLLTKIYLVDDAGKVLASQDLNNTTVVKNGSNEYELTLTGFSSVVAKDTTRVYTIKADIEASIESADITEGGTIALADNGVRGIDGAGIDLYSPANDTTVTKTLVFSASLAESASLTVSNNSNSNPQNRELVAASGSNEDEADKIVLMVFDIKAEKDDLEITDMINFVVTRSAGAATASTTYLYVGNGTSGQLLGTDALSGSDADFDNISYTIPAGQTRTFTLAADIRSANATQTTIDASWTADTTNLVAENSEGDTVNTITGSAAANNLLVRNVGAMFSLVGTPTVSYAQGSEQNSISTTSATATFRVRVEARGSNILLGMNGSTTPFVTNAGYDGTTDTASFIVYRGGSSVSTGGASSTDITTPSGYTVSSNTITLSEGSSVEIPVAFRFEGRTTAGALITSGIYAVGLEQFNWVGTNGLAASTFGSGLTEWRTPSVTMP